MQCSPLACTANTECTRTDHCVNSFCALCSANSACDQADYSCVNSTGICINEPTCVTDATCDYNNVCNGTDGFCEIQSCAQDSDCRSLLCDTTNGQCLTCNTTDAMCPTGYSCQAESNCELNECTPLTIYTDCTLNQTCNTYGKCTDQTCTVDTDCRSHNCVTDTCMSCSIANPCQPDVTSTTEYYCMADGQCVAAYCDPDNVWAACFPNEYCNTTNF